VQVCGVHLAVLILAEMIVRLQTSVEQLLEFEATSMPYGRACRMRSSAAMTATSSTRTADAAVLKTFINDLLALVITSMQPTYRVRYREAQTEITWAA
jgi:hypothetical protein